AALSPAASPPMIASRTRLPHHRARRPRERVLRLLDDSAHDVAGRLERANRTNTLTRWVALLVRVHAGRVLVAAKMQRVRGDRLRHLLRELAQFVGMLLDVARPIVAQRAQRLSREPAADDRLVFVCT